MWHWQRIRRGSIIWLLPVTSAARTCCYPSARVYVYVWSWFLGAPAIAVFVGIGGLWERRLGASCRVLRSMFRSQPICRSIRKFCVLLCAVLLFVLRARVCVWWYYMHELFRILGGIHVRAACVYVLFDIYSACTAFNCSTGHIDDLLYERTRNFNNSLEAPGIRKCLRYENAVRLTQSAGGVIPSAMLFWSGWKMYFWWF